MRHPLLGRQLKRLGLTEDGAPSSLEWRALLHRIDRTYVEGDQDRYTLERSLSTSSTELQRLYEDLRRSSEDKLTRQRNELDAIITATIEAAPDGILVVDALRRVVAFNNRFCSLWDLPVELVETRDDDALIAGVLSRLADPEEFLARVRHLYANPLESSHEEILLQDGRIFDRHSAPVLTSEGECRGRVWFFRDITARRLAEEQLRQTNAFLDSIVENIPNMIFVKGAAELRFERFNRAGEQLLGLSREQLIGKSDRDLFPAAQADAFQRKDRQTLAGGKVVDVPEEPIQTPSGTRWLHTKKIPIRDANGVPKYLLGISSDITDRKLAKEVLERANEDLERRVHERTADLSDANAELTQQIAERERAVAALRQTEEQLRMAQKMEAIGRLAGGVAHDFNNMLAVIVGSSEMLLNEIPCDSPVREEVEEIHKAGMRSASLTHQLLAFSRQQVLQPEVVALNVVVEDIEKMLRRLIGEDIECVTRLERDLGDIEVDRGQIQQVIVNLSVNARDAMPDGGRLAIETATVAVDEHMATTNEGLPAGSYVCLSVCDTGVGMAAEVRARIFEPFFTTKERGRGTGLGLAMVYGIVRQSGGHITVESEVGRGTTFRVYFPIVRGTHAAPPVQAAGVGRGGHETILLVEDEELVRRAASRILRKKGYTVLDATTPEHAIALAKQHGPTIDLVLTDVIMPRIDGYELARRLLAEHGSLRVLYMSGYTDAAARERSGRQSDAPFLQKPFGPAALLSKVREVLDRAGDVDEQPGPRSASESPQRVSSAPFPVSR